MGTHQLILNKTGKKLSKMCHWHVLIYSDSEKDFTFLLIDSFLRIRMVSPACWLKCLNSNFSREEPMRYKGILEFQKEKEALLATNCQLVL